MASSKGQIPAWLQGLGALAAVAMIAAGASFSYGQLTTQVQDDHDIILEIRDDVKEIKRDLDTLSAEAIRRNGRLDLHDHRITFLENTE